LLFVPKKLLINEKTTLRNKQLKFAPGGEAVVYYNFQRVRPSVWIFCTYQSEIFNFQVFMPKNTLLGNSFATPRFDEQYLGKVAQKALNRPVVHVGFSPLQGDASTRQYYRLSMEYQEGALEPRTLILMQLEAPNVRGETDFIHILKFLQDLHLPVPELFYFDAERGLLLLQDCGDLTLEAHLHSATPEALKSWYLKAVHLLATMQTEATRAIGVDCPAYHLKFDVEKLMWEMDFMLEHFIEGTQQSNLKSTARKELRKQLSDLCTLLAGQTPWFTHRDYHSRNLMVHNDELVLLDFQDARMGPSQYDLASLLRDSYLPLPDAVMWELVDAFIQKKQELGNHPIDRDEFIRVFDLMSIQRNLKAIGTFGYQKKIKNNDRYMRYIAPTLEYVRQAFTRRIELKPLHTILSEAIPDL
jgi:aminoglycoside/choline kinase family phosphotransferase